jgi:UDP:flavonoid glycosyltransferase YjiC (YdhE family)
LGLDLRHAYTDADFVAYADLPDLFPIPQLPPTHQFIGPILWEPPASAPAWWEELPKERRILYVTLGSSGQASLLPAVIEALAELDVSVVIATAGRTHLQNLPANVYAADFLPGIQAAKRASLVICNGGSLTCYQALSSGVPVIGIASNLDQLLNMQALERVGAGITMRADRFDRESLQRAVKQMLSNASIAAAAKHVADQCSGYLYSGVVGKMLDGIVHPSLVSE